MNVNEWGKNNICLCRFLPYDKQLIGKLYASMARGKEFYSFEYDEKWLEQSTTFIDPDLQLYNGRQYVNDDKNILAFCRFMS